MSSPENQQLVTIFKDLQRLCNILNAGTIDQQTLPAMEFQDRICSIQYRLLGLQGNLESTISEALRLGMLALLATTIQVPGAGLRYPYLSRRFQKCCGAIETSEPHLRNLMLWFLTVGAISLFGAAEPWLRERWRAEVPSQTTWEEARLRLKGMMWIDTIHDEPGQSAFERLSVEEAASTNRDNAATKVWASGWAGSAWDL